MIWKLTYTPAIHMYCHRNNSVTFITQIPLHIGIANFKVGWFNFQVLNKITFLTKSHTLKSGQKNLCIPNCKTVLIMLLKVKDSKFSELSSYTHLSCWVFPQKLYLSILAHLPALIFSIYYTKIQIKALLVGIGLTDLHNSRPGIFLY